MGKIKKKIKIFYIKFLRLIRNRSSLPKDMTESETKAVKIFLKMLKDKSSDLYYNPKNSECFIKNSENELYIILEYGNNMKIINSVFGYDIQINDRVKSYIFGRFLDETSNRRQEFKETLVSKVQNSLSKTLESLS